MVRMQSVGVDDVVVLKRSAGQRLGQAVPRQEERRARSWVYVIAVLARIACCGSLFLTTHVDNEFTQLMKGLQGERLRQAFKFLDKDQDGYIRPEQFKKIILVRATTTLSLYCTPML